MGIFCRRKENQKCAAWINVGEVDVEVGKARLRFYNASDSFEILIVNTFDYFFWESTGEGKAVPDWIAPCVKNILDSTRVYGYGYAPTLQNDPINPTKFTNLHFTHCEVLELLPHSIKVMKRVKNVCKR